MIAGPRRVAALLLFAAAAAGCAAGGGSRAVSSVPSHVPPRSASNAARGAAAATLSPLLVKRCGGCHAVPLPQEMTAQEWLAGLTRMQRRIHLAQADWDSLSALAER